MALKISKNVLPEGSNLQVNLHVNVPQMVNHFEGYHVEGKSCGTLLGMHLQQHRAPYAVWIFLKVSYRVNNILFLTDKCITATLSNEYITMVPPVIIISNFCKR